MPIPFLDMRGITAAMREDLIAAATRVIDSGWFVLGEEVVQFERDYAVYCETQRCVGVANGLEALTLALRALDIGPGDEVIVPANTYIATWLAVSHVGARPVPVEPDERTYNIDPARIAAAITPRTRVILPVHLYGQPADLDPIRDIARHHGLSVLEDGAQAQGARYQGRRLGAEQSLVAWSFYPGKNHGWNNNGNRGWNRDWRRDNRYNYNYYRIQNRNIYHLPRYYAPPGWGYGYRRFSIGFTLNSFLYDQDYWIDDADYYRLPPAYGPYRWVRYYNDALLVDIRTGYVVDTVYDIFW